MRAMGAAFASLARVGVKKTRNRLRDGYEQRKPELLRRLRKIEGQVRGIQQMIGRRSTWILPGWQRTCRHMCTR